MKRTIYVSGIDRSTRPVTYREPVPYRVNVLPSSSQADIEAYGDGYAERMTVVCDSRYGKDIREFDLVYVYAEPPVPTDESTEDTAGEPEVEPELPEDPDDEVAPLSEIEPDDADDSPDESDDPEEPDGGDEPSEDDEPEDDYWWDGFASGADFYVESVLPGIGDVVIKLNRRAKTGGRQ